MSIRKPKKKPAVVFAIKLAGALRTLLFNEVEARGLDKETLELILTRVALLSAAEFELRCDDTDVDTEILTAIVIGYLNIEAGTVLDAATTEVLVAEIPKLLKTLR